MYMITNSGLAMTEDEEVGRWLYLQMLCQSGMAVFPRAGWAGLGRRA